MRTLPTLVTAWLTCWLSAALAHAEPVLFLYGDDRSRELGEALELELRGHGTLLGQRASPAGDSGLARAAAALAEARAVSAAAAVWLELDAPARVRALSTRRELLFEAPLPRPLAELDPRLFAMVAGSVVLEALAAGAEGAAPVPTSEEGFATPAETSGIPPAIAPVTLPEASGPTAGAGRAQEDTPAGSADAGDARPFAESSELAAEYRARSIPGAGGRVRLFLRAGLSLALARVTAGLAADRTLSQQLLDNIDAQARGPDGSLNPGRARNLLLAQGFDCAAEDDVGRLLVRDCSVAVSNDGVVLRPGLELAAGVSWSRYSVAFTTRVSPEAGRGRLAHALLGVQLGLSLTRPRARGGFAELVGGAGVGQIQALPSTGGGGGGAGPWVQAGLCELRGGALFGYRFGAGLGLYGGLVVHQFFPDKLTVFDPSFGIEGRL